MNERLAICWLRRDLRLNDQTALAEACRRYRNVALVFVFDTKILGALRDKADRRVVFIRETLAELATEVASRGSKLIVLHGDPAEEIPALATRLGADAVFTNEDYEAYAKNRDSKVARALTKVDIGFYFHTDHVVFAPSEVLKDDGTPYQVYTPYQRTWMKRLSAAAIAERVPDLSRLAPARLLVKEPELPTLEKLGFRVVKTEMQGGERAGAEALKVFLKRIENYERDKDFPALDATSKISVHLRFGTVAIRQAVRACVKLKSAGAQNWLRELVWRDFFVMILDRFPHVEKSAFKPQYDKIVWPGKEEHFTAWCEGRTGYPIVDAAMRQLNATGFMHNRLRMVAASFLVKDLLIDWRKGERYFAEKLLDFDLAANNGGWQWCASTGCDAQPYFRIFNPDSQTKKFDPEGVFLKLWVPEASSKIGRYPSAIVDHETQRRRAIALFKELKG